MNVPTQQGEELFLEIEVFEMKIHAKIFLTTNLICSENGQRKMQWIEKDGKE